MLFSPQAALAGPVVVDGVQYNNEEQARLAIQRSVQVRVEQVSPDYLKAVNVAPMGGRFAVEIPNLEEARLKYVVVSGGIFKPGKGTQNLVAESVIANIKVRFLSFKKVGFIDDVVFLEQGNRSANVAEYDYIVSFSTEFDGERSPQAGHFRKTEWLVQKRNGGQKQAAVTAYGVPTNVNDLVVFSGLRNAVSVLNRTADQPQIMVDEITKSTVSPVQPPTNKAVGASLATQAIASAGASAGAAVAKQERNPNSTSSAATDGSSEAAKNEDVVLEKALSRCISIGFKRDTNEFRTCVTEQINLLSK